ncbi:MULTISPECIES: ABC-three component system middle component 1 [unclassified Pseudomonas]|uniref:ABC-three component system middle component 1 n=1 Tax=unclassified Pseudomonas TaxID=196821 RepID=UPI0011AF203E|nr:MULTISPECIES: ABC-three component system middle component 1 [unclassified Pseudomonas]
MNLISANSGRISQIKDKFPNFAFNLFTAGDSEFISCIACWAESSQMLEQNWNAIQNVLALVYKAEKKVARWNVYIAFFCKDSVSRPLKLLIENDKFTARKLVFDSCTDSQSWLKEEFALKRLNYEIFEVDLAVSKNFGTLVAYKPSSLVSHLKDYTRATAEGRVQLIEQLLAEHGGHENKES